MDDVSSQIEPWVLTNYAQAAVTTLCVADHIQTWHREYSSIWRRKITGISVLFLVNRYMLLLSIMIQAVLNFPGNGTDDHISCNQCENKAIFGIASAFIISRFALDIWSTLLGVGVSTIESPFQNIARTVKHSVEMQRLNQSSITQLIIRDGTVYFLETIFNAVSLKSENLNNFLNFANPFFDILPNLLISRLMLNLRTYSEPGNTTISQGQKTNVSSLNFASNRMLGNIGAPLDGGSFNEPEQEEEEGVKMEAIRTEHERSNELERQLAVDYDMI
ncbi:hypothetical protein C8J55DRAFT_490652 [Lentinula edodes]|uniref:DUF6533 domain-containing protein n=1 Tax=Lentinula lateritia TaxID=40482 RepID=A0A9W9A5C0_9AGAR|nr:hypothetical protein C8J55DRAFT_490652 [Lentinula edodes]